MEESIKQQIIIMIETINDKETLQNLFKVVHYHFIKDR